MEKISTKDVLFDLKFLLKEIYDATFTAEEACIKVSFKNGESFIVSVEKLS